MWNHKYCILLIVLIAVAVTLIHYIDFGTRDQIAELPIVMRAMDPDFLVNDFYTNAASGYGPRYLYARLLAAVADRATLPVIAFLLTLLINISVAGLTFYVARHLFDGSVLAGLLAVAAVMTVTTFKLGYFHFLHVRQLLSNTLVLPFIFLSLGAAIKQRPYLWALSASLAVLIHPAFGAEAGMLGFVLMTAAAFFKHQGSRPDFFKTALSEYMMPLLLFLLVTALPLIPYLSMEHIGSREFIDIETRFRHGHHNLLGNLPGFDQGLYFFIAAAAAWYFWQKQRDHHRALSRALRLVAVLLLVLCLLGLIFVHLVPLRLWAIARPFRLLFLAKWLGLILIAGNIAVLLERKGKIRLHLDAVALLVSLLSPLTLALAHFIHLLRTEIKSPVKSVQRWLSPAPLLAGLSGYLVFVWKPQAKYWLPYLFFTVLALVVYAYRKKRLSRLLPVILIMLLLLPVFRFTSSPSRFPPPLNRLLSGRVPKLTLAQLEGAEVEIARMAGSFSPAGTVFLTPPEFGVFRLVAERALVVDWKSFPFQDLAMKEWFRRLEDCYGPIHYTDYKGKRQIMNNYRLITDEKIRSLRRHYDFPYAVLHRDTPSRLPVTVENEKFKIVALTR